MQTTESIPAEQKLHQLNQRIVTCRACPLNSMTDYTTSLGIPGDGTTLPSLLVIGEAPGADEARLGIPFVGLSGSYMREKLYSVGATRDQFYITNVVKHRPPENRDPTLEEKKICGEAFLKQEINLLKPKIILCVGRHSTLSLIQFAGLPKPKGSLRGLKFRYQGIPVLSTWHPAYVLRNKDAETEEAFMQDITLAWQVAQQTIIRAEEVEVVYASS